MSAIALVERPNGQSPPCLANTRKTDCQEGETPACAHSVKSDCAYSMGDELNPILADAGQLPTFDLSEVKLRIARDLKWPQERIEQAVADYLVFMRECRTKRKLVPEKDVDEVWHNHILYTRQYAKECMDYFGFFVHHQPHPVNETCSKDCCMKCCTGSHVEAKTKASKGAGCCGGHDCEGGGCGNDP